MRLPSISSTQAALDMSNLPVVEYLAGQFEQLGFSCEIVESPSDTDQPKANLIATLGTGPGGLVLAGHTDTVPMDEELWQVPPLQLTERDNRLYGLGSTDMKGFFALILEAVETADLDPATMQQPLIVLATADEETSMHGARSLAESGRPRARYAVIGEPTGLRAVRAHKGMMMEAIRLHGRSGHSSDPSLGNNALEAMNAVINELLRLRAELQQQYRDPLFDIDFPTMNLGCIHGGDNPNRICGHCELEFDVRPVPGMEPDEIRALIRKRTAAAAEPFHVRHELVSLFPGVAPFHTAADGDLVRTAERLTGHSAKSVAFGTEAPLLQQLGMETIVLGPGDIEQAHQPDEYLSLDRVRPCVELLQRLINHYCRKSG